MTEPHRSQAGFTIIEAIVGFTALTIFAAGVVTTFWAIEGLNRQTRNLTIATQLLQQQLEIYRNTPYLSITTGTDDHSSALTAYPSLRTPRSFTATITEPQAGSLKQVNLSLSYKEGARVKTVEVSSYIAVRGLNR